MIIGPSLLSIVSITIALVALVLSVLNLWVSQFRKGKLLLSQPTIIFFGWDDVGKAAPKIMIRSALFSTGNRGHVVENLHVKLHNKQGEWDFPYWGYDDGKGMVKGSGLFIGVSGQSAYHHFNPIHEYDDFFYEIGANKIEVWAQNYGDLRQKLLGTYQVDLNDKDMHSALAHHEAGVTWDWSPTDGVYYPSVVRKRN